MSCRGCLKYVVKQIIKNKGEVFLTSPFKYLIINKFDFRHI